VSTCLLLVRHGESEWNRSRQYAGQQDVPLSELGREQARRLGERLKGERLTAIYSSPLQRASETAGFIGRSLGLPVLIDPNLKEIHHGLWEGLTVSQVRKKYRSEYARWRSQPQTVVMPEGESLADVAARVRTFLDRVQTQAQGGRILVCSHDATLRVLLLEVLGLGLENYAKWQFENASVSEIRLHHADRVPFGRLVRLNENAHLAGVGSEYALQAQ
jgi:alpha-ribazole phosphatase